MQSAWWERRSFLLGIVLASAVPLLWPAVPPLVDVFGHLARYRVQLGLDSSEHLQRYYEFRWALIGNLGADLLVIPLTRIVGLEAAVKMIVTFIPPLTTLGLFAVARQVHGRVPPTALFAVPFVYSYPFHFGFINFALSMALALLAFALWLRLERRRALRAAIFLPLACLVWLVHVFGWGVLGVLAFGAEFVRSRNQGKSLFRAVGEAALGVLPLCAPFPLMVAWRGAEAAGDTGKFLLLPWKLLMLGSALRDRWLIWDALGVAVALVVMLAAGRDPRLGFAGKLAVPMVGLGIVYVLLPSTLFGSAYTDMRLAPYLIILGLIGIGVGRANRKFESRVALIASAFILCRLIGNTISLGFADLEMREKLRALDRVPEGAAVLTLVAGSCKAEWSPPRLWHLGSFVTSRKDGFSNDQWQLPGSKLMSVHYPEAKPYDEVGSILIYSPDCSARLKWSAQAGTPAPTTQESLDAFPRKAFHFVWLIKPPQPFAAPSDLKLIWRGRDSYLYRVDRSGQGLH